MQLPAKVSAIAVSSNNRFGRVRWFAGIRSRCGATIGAGIFKDGAKVPLFQIFKAKATSTDVAFAAR
ncbi:MAG: hypothetical protein HC805_04840 [Alkalinema sp. RL_2_19]|nr:hypothetical protein [Alkalinema sp. RL_2_19]